MIDRKLKGRKVGVVTIWDIDNYGNRLQNCALIKSLTQLGMDTYTLKIWSYPKWKRIIQYITNYDVSTLRLIQLYIVGDKRKYHFLLFEKNNMRKDRHFYNVIEDCKLLNKKYNYFIVGSDQVWHPVFLKESYFFLEFVKNRENTIAYAPSIGVSNLSEEQRMQLKKGTENIHYISVREKRASEILHELTGVAPSVLIDPTMLISKREWMKLEKKPHNLKEEHYILIYYLGEISEKRWEFLHRISHENKLQLVVLGDSKYREFYSAGPAEFLYLIHHATLVCTDSFHGSVFSILFETPFYVFEREDRLDKMNSRLDTLLEKLHMQKRLKKVGDCSYSFECDFKECNQNLEIERKRAYEFLMTAFHLDSMSIANDTIGEKGGE